MWKVGASTRSYLPSMLRYSQLSSSAPRAEAAAHERREVVGVGELRERERIVAAASEQGVYGADQFGQLLSVFWGSPRYLRKRIPSARAPCAQYCMRPSSRAPPRIWAPFRWLPHVSAGGHALQGGRLHDGGVPLGLAEVGEPYHPHAAGGAGQLRGPLDGVVAVLELAHERGEFTLRGVAAADVLDRDDVAAPDGLTGSR